MFILSHHMQRKANALNAPGPGLLCRWLVRTILIEHLSVQESKQKPKATPTKSYAKLNSKCKMKCHVGRLVMQYLFG